MTEQVTCHVPGPDAPKVFCAEMAKALEGRHRTGLMLSRTVVQGQVLFTSGPFYRPVAHQAGYVVRFCPFCGGKLLRPAPDPSAPRPPKPHIPRLLP